MTALFFVFNPAKLAIKSLFFILDGNDEVERVVGELVVEGAVVAEFHEETPKDVGADAFVSVGFDAPGVGVLLGH